MAIKDIAVAYNASGNADSAVDMALQMCRKYDATLTGIYAAHPVRFEGNVERWVGEDVLKRLRAAEGEVTAAIEDSFRRRTSAAMPEAKVSFFAQEGQANIVLARQARYHDILLMGQFSAPEGTASAVRAEDLVTRTGRPLLVVPQKYEVRPFEEYAVVGWDGSRQAARALSDAMQILETKKRLDVVTVRSSGADGAPAHSDALEHHFKRHGIDARQVTLTASREGIAKTLLDYCSENGPDILVMGAYGHAKLREDLFGGVTRRILENMTVPVVMSH